jgi:hypothetical protein
MLAIFVLITGVEKNSLVNVFMTFVNPMCVRYFREDRMNDPYDYLFKFLVIGSAGTGKSCLLHQFIENRFKEESSHTIGKHLLAPPGFFASVPVSVPDP